MSIASKRLSFLTPKVFLTLSLFSPLPPSKNYLIHYIKKRLLDSIREGRTINLFWLPAHKGIPGTKWLTHSRRKLLVPASNLLLKSHIQTYSRKLKSLLTRNSCIISNKLLYPLAHNTRHFIKTINVPVPGISKSHLTEKK